MYSDRRGTEKNHPGQNLPDKNSRNQLREILYRGLLSGFVYTTKNWGSEMFDQGVQYVHCVMHKCIMVKVGGNEKHRKCVKTRKFHEIRGKLGKVGGNN